jgi:very-short-patch-repair endonuclease
LLWCLVRNRSFDGFKFRRQKPLGPYILDFYCAETKLAVELDGGGHLDEPQILHDHERDAFLARKGIRVLRYSNRELFTETETVLEDIWNALQKR